MQHEQQDYDGDNLAEIWRSAQHRRTEDIYSWFTRFFKKTTAAKSTRGLPNIPKVTPAHWKTGRRATSAFVTFRTRRFL